MTAWDTARTSAETMWAGDAASRSLGMEIVQVGPGTAQVSMVVRPDMINGWEVCHGGFIASLADSAFALACNSHGQVTVAAGFDIVFLESARRGDTLVATAAERSTRGRNGIYDVTVNRAAGEGSAMIAEFRGRSRSLDRRIGD
ncbi:hydroxyphenylacetyl-CoA thioesterase PaaI [Aeromicrobium chenweiae]|uniref:Hydroxyphenylacetyl-CoA thioesterase PaaI n=1 Tax=Aeromicrobium chenweiae TaxID=2079793 RepID=A0A2S0WQV0_9ACTN|nr:hydroxyphenylacetyl-CoA thioesterase PaaI [Aeromicrobium chenweiae]AWB93735.1 hydroxyphenylacetyl-CoA thioesterase PaaI [Aeromicrobium chenweiae]TGN30416.1 hydroxyphenylacetyl-CoA thioesterase PaaI [Aeromicrobium chenweiae]